MLMSNRFIMMIVTNNTDAYHNGIRITTHSTLKELIFDTLGFIRPYYREKLILFEANSEQATRARRKLVNIDNIEKLMDRSGFVELMDEFTRSLMYGEPMTWACYDADRGEDGIGVITDPGTKLTET